MAGQNLAVIGVQWGDEGKGKIVDLLCESFDVVARYQGGHNAGHTVRFGDKHYSLRLIPSGILHPGKLCLLGNGMVIDPEALLEEIESLRGLGVQIDGNLKISDSAHCILPYHKALDLAREEAAGDAKIGTTGRGIGPAYETKVSRYGIRIADLLDSEVLREKIEFACAEKNPVLQTVYRKPTFDPRKLFNDYTRYGEVLADRITNGPALLDGLIRDGKRVMFEGAQGTMLDIDHGTYPFVTSSSTVVGGVSTGLGIAPKHISRVMGVVKAYTTRVGGGPFPTEELGPTGDLIRTAGREYGATTGRPRRTGWIDFVGLRYAMRINGVEELALTKLDILTKVKQLKVCVAYKIDGSEVTDFSVALPRISEAQAVYREVKPLWGLDLSGPVLPRMAESFVELIESDLKASVRLVSTGEERSAITERN